MNITNIPPAEQVLAELRPLTNTLYEFLPEAAQQALPYFRNRDKPLEPNRYLLANMIRYELKIRLEQIGIFVEEEETFEGATEIPLEPLANNGLEGIYSGYRFKILKSDKGLIPVPGPSLRKQAFYAQQSIMLLFAELPIEPKPNVVLHWDFDPSYRLPELLLSVPQTGRLTRSSVRTYYTEPVPHPITLIQPPKPTVPPMHEPQITLKTEPEVEKEGTEINKQATGKGL